MMVSLALAGLRARWSGFIATFVGMFLCAGIMIASGGLLESGIRDTAPPDRLAAAPILIAGDTSYELPNNPLATLRERIRVDREVVDTVRSIPGVAAAIPDQSFPAAVLRGGDRPSYGHSWTSAALTPYRLAEGVAPERAGEVVLDHTTAQQAGARLGDQLQLAVRGGQQTVRVTGIATSDNPVRQAAVFFSEADVRRYVGDSGTVDTIGVFPAKGTSVDVLRQQIADALSTPQGGTRPVVLTGDDRGHGENPATLEVTDLILIGGLIGGLSLVVGLLGVASTLSLAFEQRQREMALLRAIGATPGQLRAMILGETITLSVVATALAALPGVLVGGWLFEFVVDTGLAPEGVTFRQSWIPTAVAATVSLVSSVGAALIAGRRATKTRPTQALAAVESTSTRTGRLRPTLAVVCFAISGLLVFATLNLVKGPLAASPANFATIFCGIGLALIGPTIAKALTRVAGPLVRSVSGLPGYLATVNAQARVAGVAMIVTPVMLFVAIATANLYATTTETSVTSTYTEAYHGNLVLRAGSAGFGPEMVDKVRQVDGVGAASEFITSAGFIESPTDPWQGEDLGGSQLIGLDADGAQVSSAPVAAGALTDLRGESIALTVAHANAMGARLGDTITIRLGDGTKQQLRLVATFEAKASFESILLPADLLAAHSTAGLPDFILVKPAPGADTGRLTAALNKVAAQSPGGIVADRTALNSAFLHHLGAQALVTLLMIGMLLGYIAIQVINNLTLAVAKRKREFGLLRLTGTTKGQVIRMMGIEGTQAGVIGIVLGTVVTPLTLIPFSIARTGAPIPAGPLWIYFAVVGFAALLAVAGTLLPTWLALRSSALDTTAP